MLRSAVVILITIHISTGLITCAVRYRSRIVLTDLVIGTGAFVWTYRAIVGEGSELIHCYPYIVATALTVDQGCHTNCEQPI